MTTTVSTQLSDVLRRSPNALRGEPPVRRAARPLRVLFLVSAHNSLSQRAHIALTELGHDVTVAVLPWLGWPAGCTNLLIGRGPPELRSSWPYGSAAGFKSSGVAPMTRP